MTRLWTRAFLGGLALSLAVGSGAVPASADTLFGAMEKAYVTNPTLNAARAGQRALLRDVAQREHHRPLGLAQCHGTHRQRIAVVPGDLGLLHLAVARPRALHQVAEHRIEVGARGLARPRRPEAGHAHGGVIGNHYLIVGADHQHTLRQPRHQRAGAVARAGDRADEVLHALGPAIEAPR